MPRSWVCLNQAGSLEPNAAAMSFREGASPASFSAADAGLDGGSTDVPLEESGRERTEPMPRDRGRCCQDSVPLRDKDVAFVDGNEGDSCPSREVRAACVSRSGLGVGSGRLDRVGLSSARRNVWARDRGVRETGGSIDRSCEGVEGEDNGAAGPVLFGDIERARSVQCVSDRSNSGSGGAHTCPSGLTLLFGLHHLLFGPASLFGIAVVLLAQAGNSSEKLVDILGAFIRRAHDGPRGYRRLAETVSGAERWVFERHALALMA